MSRRFGSEGGEQDEEMAAARRRHDEEAQREWARDKKETDAMWIRNEARREAEEGHLRNRASGHWQFEEMLTASGGLIGWRVVFNGKLSGVLMLRGDDIMVISGSTDSDALRRSGVKRDFSDPLPEDIMAAFMKLYPGGAPQAHALPRGQRQLPAENFGPPRDWSEE